MKYFMTLCALLLALTVAAPSALAAGECYPTVVTQSEDGTEIRKIYDLSSTEDPAGIPRSDFEQNGWYYTMTDLLRQELPEYQEREHTEEVHVTSKNKDMGSILALLPGEKEIVTDDGLSGVLTLQMSSIQVEVAGYGSSTKEVSTTRRYTNLDSQDTQYIPKTVEEGGRTMTLQSINWQSELAAVDDFTTAERYTAVATYTGTATSSYVTGYDVTAEYTGTVSRIAMDRVRYVAVFQRTTVVQGLEDPDQLGESGQLELPEEPGEPELPEQTEVVRETPGFHFNWAFVLVPLVLVILAGGGIGAALFIKRRKEAGEEEV